MLTRPIRQHHYPEMLLKINKDQEVLLILNEHSSADWPILINPPCIMFLIRCLWIKSNSLSNPITVVIFEILHLHIGSVEVSENLHNFPFYLEFGLFGHQGGERSASEVTVNFDFEVFYLFDASLDFHYLLIDGCCFQGVEFIAVSKVKSWM